MPKRPWSGVAATRENFRQPPREYGILPFWFLNGELDPDEMRHQLREFRIDITDHVRSGDNTLELRVANTLINLLEAVPRPSGLAGPPTVGVYETLEVAVPVGAATGGDA